MGGIDARFDRHGRLWELIRGDLPGNDLAHDERHVLRVYDTAITLANAENADPDLAGAAALLHDLVEVPKESAERSEASRRSAAAAIPVLERAGYDRDEIPTIAEAVHTCSWSSGLEPTSALGAVLQDADRLDAIGAVGIARTFLTAQAMKSRGAPLALYDTGDPLAREREPDDRAFALDHFAVKLLRLAEGMHTAAARAEAERRQRVMHAFLEELGRELGESAFAPP
jgi:uncharacterized protein